MQAHGWEEPPKEDLQAADALLKNYSEEAKKLGVS